MAGTSSPTASTSQVSQAMPLPASEHLNCPLCHNTIEDHGSLIWCRHAFCFNCIMLWSTRKAACPICQWPFQYILRNLRATDYTVYYITWSTISASHAQGGTYGPDTAGRHHRRPSSRDRGGSRATSPETGRSRSQRQHRDAHRRVQHARGYDPSTSSRHHQRREDTDRDEGQASTPEGNVVASWERSEHRHQESWLSSSERHATRSRSRWRSRSSRRHAQEEEPRLRDRYEGQAPRPEGNVVSSWESSEHRHQESQLSSSEGHATRSRSRWRSRSSRRHAQEEEPRLRDRDEIQAPRPEGNMVSSWERSEHHHHESWLSSSDGHATRSRSQWRSRSSRRRAQQEEPRLRDRDEGQAPRLQEGPQLGGWLSSSQRHTTSSLSRQRSQSPDGRRA